MIHRHFILAHTHTSHNNYIISISIISIFAVIFFCLAAVIFPIGFSQEAIGGAPYQLPNSYQATLLDPYQLPNTCQATNLVILDSVLLFDIGGNLLHFLCDGLVDDGHLRALCKQSVSTTLLDASS